MRRQRLASCCCGHLSPLERSCAARCALAVLLVELCLCFVPRARLEICRADLFMDRLPRTRCSKCMSGLGGLGALFAPDCS